MSRPALLLWDSSDGRLLGDALSNLFKIVRRWEASDPDALLAARGADVTATLTTRLDAHALALLPNLRLIAVPGAGYEHIDVGAARARGITVANAGDAHSGDVADHAVALTLASVHRLSSIDVWVLNGDWGRTGAPERRHAMSAKRFGIVGLGNIGTAIAKRLAPFGGEIAWWAPRNKEAPQRCVQGRSGGPRSTYSPRSRPRPSAGATCPMCSSAPTSLASRTSRSGACTKLPYAISLRSSTAVRS